MSDTYQAVYDATRSRIGACSTGEVIERAAREAFDIGNVRMLLAESIGIVEREQTRPSVLMRPSIGIDGNQWCALYGDNLQ